MEQVQKGGGSIIASLNMVLSCGLKVKALSHRSPLLGPAELGAFCAHLWRPGDAVD
jgi:hypothetical protein